MWIRLPDKEENRQEIDALVARQYRTVNSSVKSDIVTPPPSSTVITFAEEVMFSPVVSWFDSRIAQKTVEQISTLKNVRNSIQTVQGDI